MNSRLSDDGARGGATGSRQSMWGVTRSGQGDGATAKRGRRPVVSQFENE